MPHGKGLKYLQHLTLYIDKHICIHFPRTIIVKLTEVKYGVRCSALFQSSVCFIIWVVNDYERNFNFRFSQSLNYLQYCLAVYSLEQMFRQLSDERCILFFLLQRFF